MNKWWGYLHTNGTVHVKRYFNDHDLDEADESPFVKRVTVAFEASDRDDALKTVKRIINGWDPT